MKRSRIYLASILFDFVWQIARRDWMKMADRYLSRSRQPVMVFVRLLGKRAFWSFFLVTFLIVSVLAATNIVSKYAIKVYTEDQLRQLRWDSVLYQSQELSRFTDIRKEIAGIRGVKRIESLACCGCALLRKCR